jgi:hypothetical protein
MPAYFRRTLWFYETLRDYPLLTPNPARPHASMLHLHLPVGRDRALDIRNRIAGQHGVWLFNGAHHAALPDRSYVELYVGDNLLNLPDDRVREILSIWSQALSS